MQFVKSEPGRNPPIHLKYYVQRNIQREALKGTRKGQHSIRINDQWRICFTWRDGAALNVEIVDYH